ncbi:MAG: tetratricopeptide repeat protein [Candidatus Puniceispirillaceae bacterium]
MVQNTDTSTAISAQARQKIPSFLTSVMAAGCVIFLSGCAPSVQQSPSAALAPAKEPAPLSKSLSSNFLMARHAVYGNDLPSATDFFTKSLVLDDSNLSLLRHSFLTQYQSGNIEQAAEIARRMESLNFTMPLASEPALIEAVLSKDWQAVIALSDLLSQSDTSVIIAGVARAWALFAIGQFDGAYAQMSETALLLQNDVGLTPAFMELQIAHLFELAGDKQEAKSSLDNLALLDNYPPHIQLSIASAYHRLGEAQKAKDIIAAHLSPSFDKTAIITAFENNSSALIAPMTIERGLAHSLLDTSWLDSEKSIRSLLLARAQLALIIAPGFDAAHFVIAQEYLALGQHKPAKAHLNMIAARSAYYLPAQLVMISYLRRSDKLDEALLLVRDLRLALAQNARLLLLEADMLRSIGDCANALPLYKDLIAGAFDNARLHRNIGICLERTATTQAEMDEAERYFLSSLDQNPDDAFTLNYLGYWYADSNRNLDKAIDYIQKAVELRPSSGFFADSLGWVYFRLQRYNDAIEWLEKAIQLEPLDPIITEHLGDAYWIVGRHFEAIYKWQHAKDRADDTKMTERLEKKLDEALKFKTDPTSDPLSHNDNL